MKGVVSAVKKAVVRRVRASRSSPPPPPDPYGDPRWRGWRVRLRDCPLGHGTIAEVLAPGGEMRYGCLDADACRAERRAREWLESRLGLGQPGGAP